MRIEVGEVSRKEWLRGGNRENNENGGGGSEIRVERRENK